MPLFRSAAGFGFDSNKGLQVLETKTRQERVLQYVDYQESQSRERPTRSLK